VGFNQNGQVAPLSFPLWRGQGEVGYSAGCGFFQEDE